MSLFNKLNERKKSAGNALAKMRGAIAEQTAKVGNFKKDDVAKQDAATASAAAAAEDDSDVSDGGEQQTIKDAGDSNKTDGDNDKAVGTAESNANAAAANNNNNNATEDNENDFQKAAEQDDDAKADFEEVTIEIPGARQDSGERQLTAGSSERVAPHSEELQRAIAAVCPAEDALDDPAFNSIAYINNLFPSEQSLSDLDDTLTRVKIKVARLDADIAAAVREQAAAAGEGRAQLETAQSCVKQLFGKIDDIRSKAEASEAMVEDICRDIVSLDCAKRNLTASITALKRLQMLTRGIGQLRTMLQLRQYDESSKMLGGVQLFVSYFEDYGDVAQVKALKDDVEDLCDAFKQRIYGEFEALLRGDEPDEAVRDAGYVLDALGAGVRDDFVLWFAGKQLGDYEAAFSVDSDSYALEHTARRFEWWAKLIEAYEERWARTFPPEWQMDMRLAESFAAQTKLALAANLQQNRETLDVGVLVTALQHCLAFEKRLCQRFASDEEDLEAAAAAAARAARAGLATNNDDGGGGGGGDDDDEANSEDAELDDAELQAADQANPHSVDAVRRRYARFQRDKRRADRAAERARQQAKRREEKFDGMISSAFDAYMDLYIAREDKQLGEVLERLTGAEKWDIDESLADEKSDENGVDELGGVDDVDGSDSDDDDGAPPAEQGRVLQSATDLIYYFKKCRTRCAQLNKGQSLFELFLLFRRYLIEYAGYLMRQLPAASDASNVKAASVIDEQRYCLLINTAEYCAGTASSISAGFKRLIVAKFREQIDTKAVQSEFSAVIAKTMKILVGSVSARLQAPLLTMQKQSWASWSSVGDTSAYVGDIGRTLAKHVSIFNRYLAPQHGKYFADQFVGDFVPRIIQSIYKTKRISEAGAQHLLLDMSVLKSTLLRVPKLGRAKRAPVATKRYEKFVRRSMLKVEILLKLVLAPPDSLLASYKELAGELGAGTLHGDDLQRVMELKGVRQSEQHQVLSKLSLTDDSRVTSRLKRLFSNNNTK